MNDIPPYISDLFQGENIRFIVPSRRMLPLWVLILIFLIAGSFFSIIFFIESLPLFIKIAWTGISIIMAGIGLYLLSKKGPIYVATDSHLIAVLGNRKYAQSWADLSEDIKVRKKKGAADIMLYHRKPEGIKYTRRTARFIALVGIKDYETIYEKCKTLISENNPSA